MGKIIKEYYACDECGKVIPESQLIPHATGPKGSMQYNPFIKRIISLGPGNGTVEIVVNLTAKKSVGVDLSMFCVEHKIKYLRMLADALEKGDTAALAGSVDADPQKRVQEGFK